MGTRVTNFWAAVAELTERPLYSITSGELGASPTQLEEGLKRALDIAKTFHAVLLLDEADVFLERRAMHDLGRNALVSIFLRLMEYYQGVLVLTTNRIESFDEAFQSRIHISLQYPKLSAQSRAQIWRNFYDKLIPSAVDLSDEDFEELATPELNGREIKNVIASSQALAVDGGERVSLEHIKQVLEVVTSFDLAKYRPSP
jgi:AAA+ superfamily predicted ATPase